MPSNPVQAHMPEEVLEAIYQTCYNANEEPYFYRYIPSTNEWFVVTNKSHMRFAILNKDPVCVRHGSLFRFIDLISPSIEGALPPSEEG